eukprot:6212929-Pleurochrysis_carterae.AAC.1
MRSGDTLIATPQTLALSPPLIASKQGWRDACVRSPLHPWRMRWRLRTLSHAPASMDTNSLPHTSLPHSLSAPLFLLSRSSLPLSLVPTPPPLLLSWGERVYLSTIAAGALDHRRRRLRIAARDALQIRDGARWRTRTRLGPQMRARSRRDAGEVEAR